MVSQSVASFSETWKDLGQFIYAHYVCICLILCWALFFIDIHLYFAKVWVPLTAYLENVIDIPKTFFKGMDTSWGWDVINICMALSLSHSLSLLISLYIYNTV